LILQVFLSFLAANFLANLRGLLVPRSKAIPGRDGFTRDFGCACHKNLSGAISWFTFFVGGAAEAKGLGGGNSRRNGDLFLAEAEQLPLFCPIRRQPWREADQCPSCELQRLSAVDKWPW
jgi:hypothetical protein